MKISALYVNPPEYNAKVNWAEGKVLAVPPRRGKEDEYGNIILPPATRPPRGLATRFANLRDTTKKDFKKDFEAFVQEYGLLGITGLPTESFSSPKYGKSYEEEISWWLYYAEKIYRLLRLYRILKRAKDNVEYDWHESLEKVVVLEQDYKVTYEGKLQGNRYVWAEHREEMPFVKAVWADTGEETGQRFSENVNPLDAASYVLASVVSRGMAGGVTLGKGEIRKSKKSPIGYIIIEQRYTDYLLAAIFYDLWELVTNSQPVEVCAYRNCNNMFTPERKTGEYCSAACKQNAYRERKKLGQ